MHTLGVISDTHGLLRGEALALLEGVDHIIHAGDIGSPTIIESLEAIAPVSAIRGNVDVEPWASQLPDTLHVTLLGHEILVVHDRNKLAFAPNEKGLSLVISGHSHRANIESRDGVLYLNPGSAGPRRFNLPISLATIEIADQRLVPKIHEISQKRD